MGMFPSVNTDLQTQIDNVTSTSSTTTTSTTTTSTAIFTPSGKSFKFDFDTGDFVIQDGNLVVASDYESTKIWIQKILKTEKFKFKIYEKDDTTMEYGITLMDLITSNNYPLSYLKAEITREITETLLLNSVIASVDNFVFNRNKLILSVTFNVTLVDGTIIESEV
jgi:hypothetical protein